MFQVSLNSNVANIFKVMQVVRRGTRDQHPSGAFMYTWQGRTAVGTWQDGTFNLIRFYE